MNKESMERHLDTVFAGLVEADENDERREYMNALLRVAAAVIDGSIDSSAAKRMAFRVIEAALEEQEETLQ